MNALYSSLYRDRVGICLDGRFTTDPGKTLSHLYFDGTIAYFSYTHRFISPEGLI